MSQPTSTRHSYMRPASRFSPSRPLAGFQPEMGHRGGDPWDLLQPHGSLGSRPEPARSGGVGRPGEPPLLLLLIEIWPHEFYFVAGLLVMAGWGCSCSPRRWAGLVRLCLPPNRLDRPFILTERWVEGDRNAPACVCGTRPGAQDPAGADEMDDLAADRAGDGRRLDLLFHRCADAFARPVHRAGPSCRLYHHGDPDRDHLRLWRVRARTDLHLCLPWPRIQAAMMDEDTLTVAYREWRASRAARSTRARRRNPWRHQGRLHRLHGLRERLPHGHRHPRRPADGMHHLRAFASTPATTSWTRSASRGADRLSWR